jgi:excisionase family DNA binding protein
MELLTVQETAAMLKLSPITIRRYIAAGRLPAVRVGRAVRLRREAIEDFLEPVGHGRRPAAGPVPASAGAGIAGADGGGTGPEWGDGSDGLLGEPTSEDDPLWDIVGMIDSPDGPTDVSRNKHKYLAEAYADLHE